MAKSIDLVFGMNVEASAKMIKKQIDNLVDRLSKNPIKLNINATISKDSINNIVSQIQKALGSLDISPELKNRSSNGERVSLEIDSDAAKTLATLGGKATALNETIGKNSEAVSKLTAGVNTLSSQIEKLTGAISGGSTIGGTHTSRSSSSTPVQQASSVQQIAVRGSKEDAEKRIAEAYMSVFGKSSVSFDDVRSIAYSKAIQREVNKLARETLQKISKETISPDSSLMKMAEASSGLSYYKGVELRYDGTHGVSKLQKASDLEIGMLNDRAKSIKNAIKQYLSDENYDDIFYKHSAFSGIDNAHTVEDIVSKVYNDTYGKYEDVLDDAGKVIGERWTGKSIRNAAIENVEANKDSIVSGIEAELRSTVRGLVGAKVYKDEENKQITGGSDNKDSGSNKNKNKNTDSGSKNKDKGDSGSNKKPDQTPWYINPKNNRLMSIKDINKRFGSYNDPHKLLHGKELLDYYDAYKAKNGKYPRGHEAVYDNIKNKWIDRYPNGYQPKSTEKAIESAKKAEDATSNSAKKIEQVSEASSETAKKIEGTVANTEDTAKKIENVSSNADKVSSAGNKDIDKVIDKLGIVKDAAPESSREGIMSQINAIREGLKTRIPEMIKNLTDASAIDMAEDIEDLLSPPQEMLDSEHSESAILAYGHAVASNLNRLQSLLSGYEKFDAAKESEINGLIYGEESISDEEFSFNAPAIESDIGKSASRLLGLIRELDSAVVEVKNDTENLEPSMDNITESVVDAGDAAEEAAPKIESVDEAVAVIEESSEKSAPVVENVAAAIEETKDVSEVAAPVIEEVAESVKEVNKEVAPTVGEKPKLNEFVEPTVRQVVQSVVDDMDIGDAISPEELVNVATGVIEGKIGYDTAYSNKDTKNIIKDAVEKSGVKKYGSITKFAKARSENVKKLQSAAKKYNEGYLNDINGIKNMLYDDSNNLRSLEDMAKTIGVSTFNKKEMREELKSAAIRKASDAIKSVESMDDDSLSSLNEWGALNSIDESIRASAVKAHILSPVYRMIKELGITEGELSKAGISSNVLSSKVRRHDSGKASSEYAALNKELGDIMSQMQKAIEAGNQEAARAALVQAKSVIESSSDYAIVGSDYYSKYKSIYSAPENMSSLSAHNAAIRASKLSMIKDFSSGYNNIGNYKPMEEIVSKAEDFKDAAEDVKELEDATTKAANVIPENVISIAKAFRDGLINSDEARKRISNLNPLYGDELASIADKYLYIDNADVLSGLARMQERYTNKDFYRAAQSDPKRLYSTYKRKVLQDMSKDMFYQPFTDLPPDVNEQIQDMFHDAANSLGSILNEEYANYLDFINDDQGISNRMHHSLASAIRAMIMGGVDKNTLVREGKLIADEELDVINEAINVAKERLSSGLKDMSVDQAQGIVSAQNFNDTRLRRYLGKFNIENGTSVSSGTLPSGPMSLAVVIDISSIKGEELIEKLKADIAEIQGMSDVIFDKTGSILNSETDQTENIRSILESREVNIKSIPSISSGSTSSAAAASEDAAAAAEREAQANRDAAASAEQKAQAERDSASATEESANANNDGVVTLNELQARLREVRSFDRSINSLFSSGVLSEGDYSVLEHKLFKIIQLYESLIAKAKEANGQINRSNKSYEAASTMWSDFEKDYAGAALYKSAENRLNKFAKKSPNLNYDYSNIMSSQFIPEADKEGLRNLYNETGRAWQKVKEGLDSGDVSIFSTLKEDVTDAISYLDNLEVRISELKNVMKAGSQDSAARSDLSSLSSDVEAWGNENQFTMLRNPAVKQGFEDLQGKIAALGSASRVSTSAVRSLSGEFNTLKGVAGATVSPLTKIANRIKASLGQRAMFMASSLVISRLFSAFRELYTAVSDVDKAMTELKKVTDETNNTYASFTKRASETAKSIGSSVSDYINATADFARLGYDLSESETLAKVATIYKNVGDGIKSIDEASESIISTMKAFGIEADNAMSIVDAFNEVGNNYAISSTGIGTALQNSASALATANNSLEQSVALITAGNATVQDPSKVGTSLKTISMYLRAAKTDAEEAGESTDGMAESVSKLRNELLTITKGKVDIMVDDTTFKSTYDILKELSKVWNDLTDVDRANIVERIGGKRNANVITSIIQNFKDADDVIKTIEGDSGSAQKEQDKWLDSIEGRTQQLKAATQSLSVDILDSNVVKGAVTALTSMVNVVDRLTSSFGYLVAGAGLFATTKIISNWKGFGASIAQSFSSIGSSIPKALSNMSTSWTSMTAAIHGTTIAQEENNASQKSNIINFAVAKQKIQAETVEEELNAGAKNVNTTSTNAMSAASETAAATSAALSIAVASVTAALSIGIMAYTAYKNAQIKSEQNAKQAADTYTDASEKIDSYIEKYKELKKAQENASSEDVRDEKSTELLNLEKEICDQYDIQADKIDLVNGKLEDQIEILRSRNKEEYTNNILGDKDFMKSERKASKDYFGTRHVFQSGKGTASNAVGNIASKYNGVKFDRHINSNGFYTNELSFDNITEAYNFYIELLDYIESHKDEFTDQDISSIQSEFKDIKEKKEDQEKYINTYAEGYLEYISDSDKELFESFKSNIEKIKSGEQNANTFEALSNQFKTLMDNNKDNKGVQAYLTDLLIQTLGQDGYELYVKLKPHFELNDLEGTKSELKESLQPLYNDAGDLDFDKIELIKNEGAKRTGNFTDEEYDAYDKIIAVQSELQLSYEETITYIELLGLATAEATKENNKYATSQERIYSSLKKLSGSLGKVNSAWGNAIDGSDGLAKGKLSWDDIQGIVESLNELKEAGTDIDPNVWYDKLIDASGDIGEVKDVFSEMTNAIINATIAEEGWTSANEKELAVFLESMGVKNAASVAHDKLSKSLSVNKEEYESLIEMDSRLKDAFTERDGIYTAEADALSALGYTAESVTVAMIAAQFNLTTKTAEATKKRIELMMNEIGAYRNLLKAIKVLSNVGNNMIPGSLGVDFAFSALGSVFKGDSDKYDAKYAALEDAYNQLDGIMSDMEYNYTGGNSATNAQKDAWEKALRKKKHELEKDQITEEQYYEWVEANYKKYLNNEEEFADELMSIDEELYQFKKDMIKKNLELEKERLSNQKNKGRINELSYQRGVYESAKKAYEDLEKLEAEGAYGVDEQERLQAENELLEEIHSARVAMYDEETSELQRLRNMNLITDEIYYARLASLCAEYYAGQEEYVEELKKAQEELYKEGISIAKKWIDISKSAIMGLGDAVTGTIDAISSLAQGLIDANSSNFDEEKNLLSHMLQMNYIEEEEYYSKLEELYKDYYGAKYIYYKEYWDNQEEVYKYEMQLLENGSSSIETIHSQVMDMLKKEMDKTKKSINDAKDAYNELLDIRKKALNEAKDEEDYERNRNEKLASIAQLQRQLNALSNDTSAEGMRKYKEIYAQIIKAQQELDDLERDHAYKIAEKNIDNEKEALDKASSETIKAIDDSMETVDWLKEKAWELITESALDKNSSLYNQLMDYQYKYSESIKDSTTGAWDEASKSFDHYIEKVEGFAGMDPKEFYGEAVHRVMYPWEYNNYQGSSEAAIDRDAVNQKQKFNIEEVFLDFSKDMADVIGDSADTIGGIIDQLVPVFGDLGLGESLASVISSSLSNGVQISGSTVSMLAALGGINGIANTMKSISNGDAKVKIFADAAEGLPITLPDAASGSLLGLLTGNNPGGNLVSALTQAIANGQIGTDVGGILAALTGGAGVTGIGALIMAGGAVLAQLLELTGETNIISGVVGIVDNIFKNTTGIDAGLTDIVNGKGILGMLPSIFSSLLTSLLDMLKDLFEGSGIGSIGSKVIDLITGDSSKSEKYQEISKDIASGISSGLGLAIDAINDPSSSPLLSGVKSAVSGIVKTVIPDIAGSAKNNVDMSNVFNITSSDPEGVWKEIKKHLGEISDFTVGNILNGLGNKGVKRKTSGLI